MIADSGSGRRDLNGPRSAIKLSRSLIQNDSPRPKRDGRGVCPAFQFFLIGTRDFASPYPCLSPDAHGANSSTATAPSCSRSRIRENSCGVAFDTVPRRDFRCHPSCDNPCVAYRRLDAGRGPLAVQERPKAPLVPQGQRSGIAKLRNDVQDSCCSPPNSNCPPSDSRQPQVCASCRRIDVPYRTQWPGPDARARSHTLTPERRSLLTPRLRGGLSR